MNGTSAGTKAECPSFMVDLSDLFPFLKVHQLPLYMINEPINIELTFHPTTKLRTQIADSDTADIPMNIVQSELKFCADYIFYGVLLMKWNDMLMLIKTCHFRLVIIALLNILQVQQHLEVV
jgi:hypothetical protein